MNLLKQLKEVTLSVLPTGVLALVLSFALGVMDTHEMISFIFSCVLVIAGLTLFLSGVDTGLLPIGNRIGSAMTKSRSLVIMLACAMVLGVIITVPEPDVQVLASQVTSVNPDISSTMLVIFIAAGVGLMLALSLARTVLGWKIKVLMGICYALVFAIAFFNEEFFVSVAFDSGGATTGPLSVPFIMALGMGVATLRKHDDEAEFGYVALSSTGPVMAVLIFGLIYGSGTISSTSAAAEAEISLVSLFVEKLSSTGLSLLPLIIVCIIAQVLFIRMPRMEAIRTAFGILYAYIGIVIFFTGVEYSFSSVARQLGQALISLNPALLCLCGFFFGLCVVLAEPAVFVLTAQVEEASNGRIPRRVMLASLALGVGLAVVLSLVRTVYGFSIWWLLVPGYVLIMIAMVRTPALFSAIAFDSGGVATGPMSSTFLLPFAMGAAGSSAIASFGVIAMVAMMPVLVVELIGIFFHHQEEKAQKEALK